MAGISIGASSVPLNSSATTSMASTTALGGSPLPAKEQQSAAVTQFLIGKDAAGAGGAGLALGGVAQLHSPVQQVTQGGGGTVEAELRNVLLGLVQVLTQLVAVLEAQAGAKGGGPGGCGMGAPPAPPAPPMHGSSTNRQFGANAAAPAGREDADFEQQVLDLVNQERARYGLAPLQYNPTLDAAAEKHNQAQVRTGVMSHTGSGDGDPGSRVRQEGWTSGWGENVALGQKTPAHVVRAWMDSPGHRANILSANFRYLGVAHGVGSSGAPFWTQVFGS